MVAAVAQGVCVYRDGVYSRARGSIEVGLDLEPVPGRVCLWVRIRSDIG